MESQKVSKKTASTSGITKVKHISKGKNGVVNKFNALGMYYLNLESMEKNKFYRITGIRKTGSKYGEWLLIELDGEAKLYLPERYNTFSNRQLTEIGSGHYSLVNHGKEGNIYKLKLLKAEPQPPPVASTSSKELTKTNPETETYVPASPKSQSWGEPKEQGSQIAFNPTNYFLEKNF